MNLFENIIYGLISGISEFLPISSRGHQVIILQMFGMPHRNPVLDLIVHLAELMAVLTCCSALLSRINRDAKITNRSHRRHGVHPEHKGIYDLRLIRVAAIPMLTGLLFYTASGKWEANPILCAVFFVINGLILYIPDHMRQANKDARSMSAFDSIVMGLLSAFSVMPGISRVGAGTSGAVACGASRQNAYNWALVLSIPALILIAFNDIVSIVSSTVASISPMMILGYLLAAIFTYLGACASILFMRFLTVRSGLSGFAFYSWGASMLMFILYLIA